MGVFVRHTIKTLALFAFNEAVKVQTSSVTADSGKQDVAEGGEMWNSDGVIVTSQKEKFEQRIKCSGIETGGCGGSKQYVIRGLCE